MKRLIFTALCLCVGIAAFLPAAIADFYEDGYKNFFADRPKVGHARWLQLQKQGWVYLQRAANGGDAEAMRYLGNVYWYSANQFMTGYHDDARVAYPDGRLIRKTRESVNFAEGCRWYLKSASAGHAPAFNSAGYCYKNGHGVSKDYDKSRNWYRRAVDRKDYSGSFNLGNLYMEEIRDYAKARKWFQYGIDRGYKHGFYELGQLYEDGKGGAKDLAKARQLYERTDYPKAAKYRLGLMYEEGRGVKKDVAKAAHYYKQATSDDKVGKDASRRLKLIESGKAEEKRRAKQALLAEERRKKEAEQKAAEERRQAAEQAEQQRVAKLTQGLRQSNEYRKVAVANATIRALPERKGKAGRKLQLGEQVHVIGVLPSGWVRVAEEGSPVGWLHASALAAAKPSTPVVTSPPPATEATLEPLDAPYVAIKNANVRAQPNVQSDRVDGLRKGERITALGRVAGTKWILVARAGERLGYVYGALLAEADSAKPTITKAKAIVPEGLNFGAYHALVIGNDNYRNIAKLSTAVRDARAVDDLLRRHYGFKVTLLENATRAQILKSLTSMRRTLGPRDNLLIYYAGHGWLDTDADRGYWLPVDAERDDPTNWISNGSITDAVRALKAKHVMVVADSCYSGTLTRGIKLTIRTPGYMARLARKVARTVLTSGGLEPVMDSGGGGHSVFAKAFLTALNENAGVIDGHTLFTQVRRPVMLNSDQTPDYGDIRKAGHAGGDFLFVRKQ